MPHPFTPAALLTLPVLLCAGCSVYRSPTLQDAEAQATARTEDGVALLFTVEATNENDVPLPLRELNYTVELAGREVFSGTRSAEATLRRHGTQQLRLPAAMPDELAREVGVGVAPYRVRGTLTYVRPDKLSEILFDNGIRVPTVPFDISGEIDLGVIEPAEPVAPPLPPPLPEPPAPAATPVPATPGGSDPDPQR